MTLASRHRSGVPPGASNWHPMHMQAQPQLPRICPLAPLFCSVTCLLPLSAASSPREFRRRTRHGGGCDLLCRPEVSLRTLVERISALHSAEDKGDNTHICVSAVPGSGSVQGTGRLAAAISFASSPGSRRSRAPCVFAAASGPLNAARRHH